ncbi:hypothetical protein U27_04568 [Candidatus Vecturithrix granuli]|uniref:Penicillin-binding protein activator LpoB n=1 Tax=Vecturithrix granuli TaxID=1499967 RepID=A0A081BZ46_VECG1|nr:hypothetical protein U27_04568 [Candidatus Vecturithrix granuli]
MKKFRLAASILSLGLVFSLVGCATKVYRVDEREIIDLSGKWNDTDSQMVSDEMINDCLSAPWQGKFIEAAGKLPVVAVGTVYNKTDEHISPDVFVKDLERAFLNSGRARVVQSGAALDELRAVRQDQQEFASPETRKRLREELGADFILQGVINKIVDMEGKKRVYFYQVDLELVNIESAEKTWLGQKAVKKYVEKGGVRL